MSNTNATTIPSQYNALTNQECMLKAPAGSNSSANNEVHSIISSVANDINSRWNSAYLIPPPSVGSMTLAQARTGTTSTLFDRTMPTLTNCVCQNDMNAASPNSRPQTAEQMRPQTNFPLGFNGTGFSVNATPDSDWHITNLSLNRGRPCTNSRNGTTKSTLTGERPHAILSSIHGVLSPTLEHAVTKSTSISGNPHAKPPKFPVRHHTKPVAGIHGQASTSAGFHTNLTGPSPNPNRTNYRAGGVQPPGNSLHPNISGNNSMGSTSISSRIPQTPSNQNSMLAPDMRQLQQPLQPSLTSQLNTVAVGGICSQKLQQYLSDWNNPPTDNNMHFWRSFVAKYYADNSKRRLCMSTCKNKASTSLQHLQEKWQCVFCKEFSDKSHELSFNKMAESFQMQLESGMRVLLSLGPGEEKKFPNGDSVVFYKKVVQHTMRPSGSIIYEGPLLVFFNTELKISEWNFCTHSSEGFVSRTILGSQIDELLQVAKKYEESLGGNESGGDPQHEEKAINLILEFIKSRTFQGIASMNSTRNRINLTATLHKSNPTFDPMPKCGNPNMNPSPLKRTFPGNGLERDLQPGQQVTRRRLEASNSNSNSNNNAPANNSKNNMATSTSKNNSNYNAPANMARSTSNNNTPANMAASTSNNNTLANMAASTSNNNNNTPANMAASTRNNNSNNASDNLAKEELFKQKHHEWFEGMVDKILAVENLSDLHALFHGTTN